MNSRERGPSRIYTNTARREMLARSWSPSKKEVADAMSLWIPPIRKVMVEAPIEDPDSSIGALKRGKHMLEEDLRRTFSRPALAAAAVINIGIQLERAASINFEMGNRLLFVFYHDVNAGMSGVGYAIDTAEEVIRRGLDKLVLKSQLDAEDSLEKVGINILPDQQVESQLRTTESFNDAAILLREDATGFLLVEEAAKRLKGYKSRFRNPARFLYRPVREFITAGADLAEESYKINYNLTEKIY